MAGTQFSPRINFKYDFSPKTIVRLSAGKVSEQECFAESQQFLHQTELWKLLIIKEKYTVLKPEIAWNYGISLQQEFKLFGRKATWVTDFFRTDFQTKFCRFRKSSENRFYNLNGKSFANSLQTQLDFSPAKIWI